MLSDRNNMLIMTAAVLSIATMMMAPVSVGFATSYTATTQSTGNEITTDYFTVSLYSYNGSTYSPTTTMLKTSQQLGLELKRVSSTEYQLFGSPILTPDNLFLQVTQQDSTTYEYTADAAGSTISYTDNTGTHIVQGVAFNAAVAEEGTISGQTYYETVETFDPDKKYKVNIVASFSSQSLVPGVTVGEITTCNLSFNISLSVHRTVSDGSYVGGGNYVATLNEHVESQTIIEENGNGVVSGGDGDSSTYYLTDATNDPYYNNTGCEAVNISNEGNAGITKGGKANVSIRMPIDTKFVISIRHGGGGNNNTIVIKIYNADADGKATGNPIYQTDNKGIRIKEPGYAYRNGTSITKGSTTIPTNDNQWFVVSSTYGVVINFSADNNPSADQVILDIVLKPSTT